MADPKAADAAGKADESGKRPQLQRFLLNAAAYYDKTMSWLGGWRKDIRIQAEHTFLDGVKFDDTDEEATSRAFYCGPFKEALMAVKFTEEGTATDFYIEVWFSEDGSDWYKYMNDYFGDWRYEDSAGNLQECVQLPILAPFIKVRVVSSGGTDANYFIVTVKGLFNS